jgi:hypothetical protein
MKPLPQNGEIVMVTHFNSDYAVRGLAMINSLRKTEFKAPILVIAHDVQSKKSLEEMNFTEVEIVLLEDLECAYPQLLVAKSDRNLIEYFYCLSPFVIRYAFDIFAAKRVIYLDADLYFYKSPELLINSSDQVNVVVVAHNYPTRFKHLEVYGKFNVGWLQFSGTQAGLDALNWWSEACLTSTSSELSRKVYGDQKYLDELVSRFSGIEIRRNFGENLAPWNLFGKSIQVINGESMVNNYPLFYFHFSGIRFLRFSVILGTSHYSYRNRYSWKKGIYEPYISEVSNICSKIHGSLPNDFAGTPLKMIVKALVYRDLRFHSFRKNYL